MQVQNKGNLLKNKFINPDIADSVEIIVYTDPLCCWSWAMEPQWRKFQYEYRHAVRVTYKMTGLLPSWRHFNDAVNSITRPAQMGPEWRHAYDVSGMEINDRIWIVDPPASSFPACIAVKCVQIQSADLGARYLRLVREAVMIHGRNISRTETLLSVAGNLASLEPSFNSFDFRTALMGDTGKELFRADLQETKYLGITRTPTLVFKGQSTCLLAGFQTYTSLKNAIAVAAPGVSCPPMEKDIEQYSDFWAHSNTFREIQEFTNS